MYYTYSTLDKILGHRFNPVQANGQSVNVRLPISQLYQSYKWRLPVNLSASKIAGVYIGIETLGKSTTWYTLDNYRLYSVKE